MLPLSPSGQQIVQSLTDRHGFSVDAVTHMLQAVYNGNSSMAQFCHSEFGGSGQWMAGGMMMLGDMFNQNLKYRVSALCEDCAVAITNNQTGSQSGVFQSQSQSGGSNHQDQTTGGHNGQNSLFAPDPRMNWWPQELGAPSASGSQNQTRYAYFANARRLAVATGSDVWVYDTLENNIGGFSQQQSGDGSITFTSQFGTVALGSLPVVSRNGVAVTPPDPAPRPVRSDEPTASEPHGLSEIAPGNTASFSSAPLAASPSQADSSPPGPLATNSADVFASIDRLGSLLAKGYITQSEFDEKKASLLDRI